GRVHARRRRARDPRARDRRPGELREDGLPAPPSPDMHGGRAESMAQRDEADDLAVFESHRPALVGLAYRMLGDVGRAQDIGQDAWRRWRRREADVETPKAYLVTIVTRLCLNELDSARARREESRSDRLPEPVDLQAGGMARLEELEQLSMAIL